ncbi:MAG: acylphosphatase [Methyloprofundus sp.]|nr:MAG: acylphosphatase [Methyloprofundus sp.]
MQTVKIIVQGRVQGVYFRAYTRKTALKLSITGTVKNRSDGHVEIIATANTMAMEDFIKWCHKGPLLAKVTDVSISPLTTVESFNSFDIID